MPLGCGVVGAALVFRESPSVVLADLSGLITSARCGRRLNDVSEAQITLQECYDGPVPIPWRHALLLTWDATFLWLGPITNVTDGTDGAGTIQARDYMEWMKHRKVRTNFNSIGAPVDVATIWQTLVTQGFAQDPSVTVAIATTPTGITAERQVLAADSVFVYDSITELASTGIDWTVVLQTIVAGNLDISTTPVGVLNVAHFLNKPETSLVGDEQGNFITTAGDGSVLGLAQNAASQTLYGLLDRIESDTSILDNTSALAASTSALALRKDSPVVVGDMQLTGEAPLNLSDLIPGAIITVSLLGSFVPYVGNLRMNAVDFEADDSRWIASLSAQPVGTVRA